MANRYLIASGNSDNPAIYDGGTLPAANDVLRLNGFVWTVTSNRTIAELRCDALAPAVANNNPRQVLLANGVTLTVTTSVLGNVADNAGLFGCATAGANATVICPLFQRGIGGLNTTETINFIGYGTTAGNSGGQGMFRGAGTVNWTGNIDNPQGYLIDTVFNGTLNVTGNINQNGGLGIWDRGNANFSFTGTIQNSGFPLLDTTTATRPTITHNGPLIAGTAPVIRSRSPYYGSGPFINNGEVMALSCDRVRLLGTNNQWSMIKSDSSAQTLRTAGLLTGYPLESKVEDGTVYGPSSEFEGTLLPWDSAFAQALATAQRDLQLPSILSAITAP